MSHADRRSAYRYLVPAKARLWWDGGAGVPAAVSNVSATGCRFEGETMPRMGERLWLALDVAGLPDLRLPAKAVRESAGPDGTPRAAVRFDVPTTRVGGLELLLLQHLQELDGQGVVLIVEADMQARERMVKTVRRSGARSVAVSSVDEALRLLDWLRIETVLTRDHAEGISALLTLGARVPHARRALLGAGDAARALVARGAADVLVDDLPEKPGLHKVFAWASHAKRA